MATKECPGWPADRGTLSLRGLPSVAGKRFCGGVMLLCAGQDGSCPCGLASKLVKAGR
jgi:hypothetical protein